MKGMSIEDIADVSRVQSASVKLWLARHRWTEICREALLKQFGVIEAHPDTGKSYLEKYEI